MAECSEKEVDGVNSFSSHEILRLYESAAVENECEAFIVLFHAFMLESGFIPKDVPEKTKFRCMPINWKTKGVYKIVYVHSCCAILTCCMTCVPLYNTISVQGIVCDIECSESIDIKVQMKNFLKKEKNLSNAGEMLSNTRLLSRNFKDGFCLPLLNLLHETAGVHQLFGIRGMLDEIKAYLLQFLPVEGVVSMSAVNKNFNTLANSSQLWKYLFYRDFAKGGVPDVDSSSEADWKQMYKKEYLKKKTRHSSPRFSIYYPYVMDTGVDEYMGYPVLPDPWQITPYLYPSMPPRFPPYFHRLL